MIVYIHPSPEEVGNHEHPRVQRHVVLSWLASLWLGANWVVGLFALFAS